MTLRALHNLRDRSWKAVMFFVTRGGPRPPLTKRSSFALPATLGRLDRVTILTLTTRERRENLLLENTTKKRILFQAIFHFGLSLLNEQESSNNPA